MEEKELDELGRIPAKKAIQLSVIVPFFAYERKFKRVILKKLRTSRVLGLIPFVSTFLAELAPSQIELMCEEIKFYDERKGTWKPTEIPIATRRTSLRVKVFIYKTTFPGILGNCVLAVDSFPVLEEISSHSELFRRILNQTTGVVGKKTKIQDVLKALLTDFLKKNAMKSSFFRRAREISYGRPHLIIMYYPDELKVPSHEDSFKRIASWCFSNPMITYIDLAQIGGSSHLLLRRRMRLLIRLARLESFFLRNVLYTICPPHSVRSIGVLRTIGHLREVNNLTLSNYLYEILLFK